MYKYLLLIPLLGFCSTIAKSQSLEETQEWISNKIIEFSLDKIANEYNYEIEYKDGLMLIHSTITSNDEKPVIEDVVVFIKDIQTVFFANKGAGVALVIRMKNGKPLKANNVEKNETEFMLSVQVHMDNMKDRFLKAFNHLIELNGGKLSKPNTF